MTDLTSALGPGAAAMLSLAILNTMPENPPESLWAFPAWLYRWVHDAVKTFTSARGPKPEGK